MQLLHCVYLDSTRHQTYCTYIWSHLSRIKGRFLLIYKDSSSIIYHSISASASAYVESPPKLTILPFMLSDEIVYCYLKACVLFLRFLLLQLLLLLLLLLFSCSFLCLVFVKLVKNHRQQNKNSAWSRSDNAYAVSLSAGYQKQHNMSCSDGLICHISQIHMQWWRHKYCEGHLWSYVVSHCMSNRKSFICVHVQVTKEKNPKFHNFA